MVKRINFMLMHLSLQCFLEVIRPVKKEKLKCVGKKETLKMLKRDWILV
jgi:hypothetical protein